MSEPADGDSQMDGFCQHLTALMQAVQSLQEGYLKLEERVQTLAVPASTAYNIFRIAYKDCFLSFCGNAPTWAQSSHSREVLRGTKQVWGLPQHMQSVFFFATLDFSLKSTKVGLIISLLQGQPQIWGHRLLEENHEHMPCHSSLMLCPSFMTIHNRLPWQRLLSMTSSKATELLRTT